MTRRSPSQSLAHDRGLTAYYENVLQRAQEGGGEDAGTSSASADDVGTGGMRAQAGHNSGNGGAEHLPSSTTRR